MRMPFGFLVAAIVSLPAYGIDRNAGITRELHGFDEYMQHVLDDWNGVGIGVGVVVDDKLVFARGYGYRDYGNKLPITTRTLSDRLEHQTVHGRSGRHAGG
jgi:CubicO group peptidase (beta-lactamase class C family)